MRKISIQPIDPIAALRDACAAAGSQKAWATRAGISVTHVCDMLHGRRDPGPETLRALGLERRVYYVPAPREIDAAA